ncbi:DUF2441 domain-containing protein [Acinetobacter gyllenbergii]|uniref:DUF2441 domain-containing protein n=1 Tax=Acinetobacter gyllenbergii TaxID=134534 RepID=UPI003F57730B
MALYFTVDRLGNANTGNRFELVNDFSTTMICTMEGMLTRPELIVYLNQTYPNGLSRHGIQYLLNKPLLVNQIEGKNVLPISPMVEAIFEQVRRAEFPNLPSRMVCMFGWQSINEALEFANTNHRGSFKIHEVETDGENVFIGDMNLLKTGGQVVNSYALARKYWSGEHSSSPILEVLIPLPVTIGKEV